MRHYRAVLTVKPHLAEHASEESNVPLNRMVLEFGIGDGSQVKDPETVVLLALRDLQLTDMEYTIERTSGPEPDGFDEWLSRQPFGGPSRTPGKRLLSDSTANLMRKAWNAATESALARIRRAEARLAFNPEQEITEQDVVGL